MDYPEKEIKLYIKDLPALAERLRLCGGELIQPRTFEKNIRLDTADAKLQQAGKLLRLRQDDQVRVTFKENAHLEDGVITRTEIEFTAADLDAVKLLFAGLGYYPVVVYEKYRQTFRLGDVLVMLDELPIGNFVEVEAPNNILIEGMVQILGLDGSRAIKTNYLGLWAMAKQNAGLKVHDLTFQALEGTELSPEVLGVQPADN
jgi:adenylate cyclase class 2